MSGNSIFLDSNILLYFLDGDPEVVDIISDKDNCISFITELELLCYPGLSVKQESVIQGVIGNCRIIPFDQEIKTLTIQPRRKYALRLPDAIIAASAYSLRLPILTADKQFGKIEELEVLLYQLK